MKDEVVDVLSSNFDGLRKAFDFFCKTSSQEDAIDFESFKHAIVSLFSRRYIDSDILDLWLQLKGGVSEPVEWDRFEQFFRAKGKSYNEAYVKYKQGIYDQ